LPFALGIRSRGLRLVGKGDRDLGGWGGVTPHGHRLFPLKDGSVPEKGCRPNRGRAGQGGGQEKESWKKARAHEQEVQARMSGSPFAKRKSSFCDKKVCTRLG